MPPTATRSWGAASGASARVGPRDLARLVDLGGRRRVRGNVVLGQARRPEADADRPHRPVRSRDDELAAAAADVDDEHLRPDATALGDAEQREHRLLLVVDDVEGDVGAGLGLGHERHGVERPADRLGADDREGAGAEPARGGRVARERVDDVDAGAGPDACRRERPGRRARGTRTRRRAAPGGGRPPRRRGGGRCSRRRRWRHR